MVRWKRPRRLRKRNGEYEEYEELPENGFHEGATSDWGEEKIDELRDGEHEDNFRDPMIRLAYAPLMVSFIYTPAILLFAFFIENSVYYKAKACSERQERKRKAALLFPSMTVILEDRLKYKNEIKCLKTCNYHITVATVIISLLEVITAVYSFILLCENRLYIYPLYQLFIYYLLRLSTGYFDSRTRFFNPADIMLALTTEVIFDVLILWSGGEKSSLSAPFKRCPFEALLFPMVLALLRILFCRKHDYSYISERLLRKKIREDYIRDGFMRRYSDTSPSQ